jgi:predicted flap endonuclease-1-like 5' DNA nuclease
VFDVPILILPVAGLALLLGFGAGWLLRSRRGELLDAADWKTRLAARDRDLQEARREAAELTMALQSASPNAAVLNGDSKPGEELAAEQARADDLAERLRAAEAELADTRNLEPNETGSGAPDLLHRIEELEAELTTLASHRCPDPSAHAMPGLMSARRGRPTPKSEDVASRARQLVAAASAEPLADDLTRVGGIGTGLAKVLRSMGISTFEQLSAMDEATMTRLDYLFAGIRERAERHDWPAAARALHADRSAAAS